MSPAERVVAEIARQDAKWGQQNHANGTGPYTAPLSFEGNSHTPAIVLAERATHWTDLRAQVGIVSWCDIFLEEVFEAVAESNADKLREELIQVAAVAQQWVAAIDRQEAAG